MQQTLLQLLRCPVTKQKLQCRTISVFKKKYGAVEVEEIKDAVLASDAGFIFPVINGIPRMLVEAIYDYASFLQEHVKDYSLIKEKLEKKYADLLNTCKKKNSKTKASFEFEWNFLKSDQKDKLWHEDLSDLTQRFLLETAEQPAFFTGKAILDAGCGHGIMTTKIGGMSAYAVGIELSKAVEQAYLRNQNQNSYYLQGDLQFLPFEKETFDVLYSSGVLHHTNNTKQSLLLTETVLKKNGKICLWLYHPQTSKIHNLLLQLRKVTSKLPVKLAFVFLAVFVFPFSFLIKKIKNKRSVNYREEMIDLLDGFTPEFRFEIKHETAIQWLTELNYHQIQITTTDQFGFSVAGVKG
jgi:ubiquinone/menaquinone biosynthesis C-methylase UbiE/uncharacterized protein YbaR (Trm112 family)